jgi:hypothetical protein
MSAAAAAAAGGAAPARIDLAAILRSAQATMRRQQQGAQRGAAGAGQGAAHAGLAGPGAPHYPLPAAPAATRTDTISIKVSGPSAALSVLCVLRCAGARRAGPSQ